MKRTALRRTSWLRSNPARVRAWLSTTRKALARHVRIRDRNPERQRSEFARTCHSMERKRFVSTLPCIGCGRTPCDNAHIPSKSGKSRKGDYQMIVPACRGCHTTAHGKDGWAKVLGVSPASVPMMLAIHAAETEALWQIYQAYHPREEG